MRCSLALPAASQANPTQHDNRRPIYAIAHRVLTPSAVRAAISHGANALEIDLTAWNFEWWADHDGKICSAGAMARELFQYIAKQRQNGENVLFVWLDIKNPDYCGRGRWCSIEGLRMMVRDILEPVNVRVLYGFFETANSRGYRVIRECLDANEAICLSGETDEVLQLYETTGESISVSQRIMDYGGVNLAEDFGNCHEEDHFTCTELRQGSQARDHGRLGKVMGWTSDDGDTQWVHKLLGEAEVDGIIYDLQRSGYKDTAETRDAYQDIAAFVDSHSDTLRMAGKNDVPW